MKITSTIWARFRSPALALVCMFALSHSGWARQAPSSNQKQEKAKTRTGTIEFRDKQYGFALTLPESWKGYQVLWSEWQGNVLGDDRKVDHVLRGPRFLIRHPKWTQENPREDLPILIYTIAQWNENPEVSAAPFGPGEIGHNSKYVFVILPRWYYDFVDGWEEATKILSSKSFHTFVPEK